MAWKPMDAGRGPRRLPLMFADVDASASTEPSALACLRPSAAPVEHDRAVTNANISQSGLDVAAGGLPVCHHHRTFHRTIGAFLVCGFAGYLLSSQLQFAREIVMPKTFGVHCTLLLEVPTWPPIEVVGLALPVDSVLRSLPSLANEEPVGDTTVIEPGAPAERATEWAALVASKQIFTACLIARTGNHEAYWWLDLAGDGAGRLVVQWLPIERVTDLLLGLTSPEFALDKLIEVGTDLAPDLINTACALRALVNHHPSANCEQPARIEVVSGVRPPVLSAHRAVRATRSW